MVLQFLASLAVLTTSGFILWQVLIGKSSLHQAMREYMENTEWRKKETERKTQEALLKKQELAFDYARRWNEWPEPIPRTRITDILNTDEKEANKCATIMQDVVLKSQFKRIINFFEELGIAYKNNLVDQEVIKDFFPAAVVTYYTKGRPVAREMETDYQTGGMSAPIVRHLGENFRNLYECLRLPD